MDATRERKPRRIRCAKCDHLYDKADITAHRESCGTNVSDAMKMFIPAPTSAPSIPDDEVLTELDVMTRSSLPSADVSGWPLQKGRVSATALGLFQTCPESFRRKYVLGMYDDESGGAGIAGTAAHHSMEIAVKYQLQQGEPLPLGQMRRVYDTGFEGAKKRTTVNWGADSEMDWHGRGYTAATTWVEKVLPLLNPVAAEEMFAVWVNQVPVPVVGFIDVVTPDVNIDLKTGGKISKGIQPHWLVQGHVYLLTGRGMSWHTINWKGDYRTPSDSPLSLPLNARNRIISVELVRNTVEAIMAYSDRFGPDRVWPGALTHKFACGYCYWKERGCAWWQPQLDLLI